MWLLLMVLGSLGGDERLPTIVDTIEVNHTSQFSQVVIWRWSHEYNRMDCVDYWLVNRSLAKLDELPTSHCGFWIANYRNRDYRAKQMIETWTEHDPERNNATLFPQTMRRR